MFYYVYSLNMFPNTLSLCMVWHVCVCMYVCVCSVYGPPTTKLSM